MLRNLLINRENMDETAVIENNRNISYGELLQRSFAVQNLLPRESKENIAVFLPNGSDYISAFFAVIMSGMPVFPLNPSMTRHEVVPLLNQASVRILVTSERFSRIFDGISDLKIVCIEHAHITEPLCSPSEISDEDEPAVLLSTSGTTGKSKIVQLSERNIEISFSGYIDRMNFTESDKSRYILAAPFSSAYGIMIISVCLLKSFPMVMTDHNFTPDALYKTISEHKVTNYEGGGALIHMMELLADRPIPYDISSLKYIGFGGSKVFGFTIDKVMNRYSEIGFFQGYGMTEAAPLISKHKRADLEKTDSVGSAIKGVEIAIDSDGIISKTPYTTGEIVVKGANVMLGYYKNEAETNKVIKNNYLYTGDIGYLDDEGYLYICGRKKNIIIVNGLNVYPEEVEECIIKSNLAEDCFVYGKPDGFGGEIICADVLPSNTHVTVGDVMMWCSRHLARYKQPSQVNMCDMINKNLSGKTERLKSGNEDRIR